MLVAEATTLRLDPLALTECLGVNRLYDPSLLIGSSIHAVVDRSVWGTSIVGRLPLDAGLLAEFRVQRLTAGSSTVDDSDALLTCPSGRTRRPPRSGVAQR
jgi:hypothetical protein